MNFQSFFQIGHIEFSHHLQQKTLLKLQQEIFFAMFQSQAKNLETLIYRKKFCTDISISLLWEKRKKNVQFNNNKKFHLMFLGNH